jgi:hypothetical protein
MPSNHEEVHEDAGMGAFSISTPPSDRRVMTFTKNYGDIVIRTPDGRVWIYKDDGWEEDIDADNP